MGNATDDRARRLHGTGVTFHGAEKALPKDLVYDDHVR